MATPSDTSQKGGHKHGKSSSSSRGADHRPSSSATQSDQITTPLLASETESMSSSSGVKRKLRPVKFKGQTDEDTLILVFGDTTETLSSQGRSSSSRSTIEEDVNIDPHTSRSQTHKQKTKTPQQTRRQLSTASDYSEQSLIRTYPPTSPRSGSDSERLTRSDSRHNAGSTRAVEGSSKAGSQEFRSRGLVSNVKQSSGLLRSVSDSGSVPSSRSILHDSVSSKGTLQDRSIDVPNVQLQTEVDELRIENERLRNEKEKLQTDLREILTGDSVRALRANLEQTDGSLEEQTSLIDNLRSLVTDLSNRDITGGLCSNCRTQVSSETGSHGEGATSRYRTSYPHYSSIGSTDTVLTSASASSFGIRQFVDDYYKSTSRDNLDRLHDFEPPSPSDSSDSEEYDLVGDDEREAALSGELQQPEKEGNN